MLSIVNYVINQWLLQAVPYIPMYGIELRLHDNDVMLTSQVK